jgi:ppGpp synthetase/RelA/SpoT-type nucleotidyltranferase
MKRNEFKRLYQRHAAQLEAARKELQRLLLRGIERIEAASFAKGIPRGMFRIRLKESRVKSWESLYDKIEADKDLEFKKAFQLAHVRDLIGARLVCHNLSDVHAIVDSLEKGHWGGLHYVKPEKGDKRWIEVGQKESGYRGWHVDVRWQAHARMRDQFNFAELQVRTLLQDAWATFMHDDVYKQKAHLMLPEELFEQFKDMSNILFALDGMAQRIRDQIESAKLGNANNILPAEALSEAMFAMLGYRKVASDIPTYRSVERIDRYTVDAADGVFSFELHGRCHAPREFAFPIAGDTPNNRMTRLVVERNVDNRWERLPKTAYEIEQSPGRSNAVIIRQCRKHTLHCYRMSCRWGGVFSRGSEYVWCPWASTYRGAMKKYELSVSFAGRPSGEPRLLRVSEYPSLKGIMTAASAGRGSPGVVSRVRGRTVYTFEVKDANDDFICLFTR